MTLSELFPAFVEEDAQFECKALLDREDTLGWLKTICGFANSKGGTLFVGIEDKTHKVIGFEKEKIDKEKLFFYGSMQQHMPVVPTVDFQLLPYEIRGQKRFVLCFKIMESSVKPLMVKMNGNPFIYKRRDGFTNAATIEEIRDMAISSRPLSYDLSPTDITFSIDDFQKLNIFYAGNNNGETIKEKRLAAIGFFDEKHNIRRGARLFRDDYKGDETKVVCSLYRGSTRGDDEVITANPFTGNLIDAYQFIENFITLHSNHSFIKKDNSRIEIDSYPKRAVFEAVINALAHRDYFLSGTQINVDIFNNRLSITSPGSLYNGGDFALTHDLSGLSSRRRNELICNVFVYCKVMEAKGTGLEKIEEDYKQADALHKPFVYSKDNQFTIVLPDLTNKAGVNLNQERLFLPNSIENETSYDISVLAFCYGKQQKAGEIAAYLGISDSSFLREKILGNLVKQGYLNTQLNGRTLLYSTNEQTVFLK